MTDSVPRTEAGSDLYRNLQKVQPDPESWLWWALQGILAIEAEAPAPSEPLRAALDWALDNLDAEDEVIGDAMSWAITVRGQTTTMARSTEYESGKQKARAALQASNHPIEPSRAPNCPDCGMPISRHAKGCTNARAAAPAPSEPLRAALERLLDRHQSHTANISEAELLSEIEAALDTPAGFQSDARAGNPSASGRAHRPSRLALQASPPTAQPEAQPAEDADAVER